MGFKKNSAAAVPLKQEPARQALGAAIEQRAAAERDRTDAGARLAQAEAALTDAVTSLRETKAEVAKVTSAAVELAMNWAHRDRYRRICARPRPTRSLRLRTPR